MAFYCPGLSLSYLPEMLFYLTINSITFGAIVIVPSFFLYIVGVAGDVRLFMHLATFDLLPALIWFMVGDKAAVNILFPLSLCCLVFL